MNDFFYICNKTFSISDKLPKQLRKKCITWCIGILNSETGILRIVFAKFFLAQNMRILFHYYTK